MPDPNNTNELEGVNIDDDTTDDTKNITKQTDNAPPSIDEGNPKTTHDGSGTSETD